MCKNVPWPVACVKMSPDLWHVQKCPLTCGMASPPRPKPVRRMPKAAPTRLLKYLFMMMMELALLNPIPIPEHKYDNSVDKERRKSLPLFIYE